LLWEEPLASSSDDPYQVGVGEDAVVVAEATGMAFEKVTRLRRLDPATGRPQWQAEVDGLLAVGEISGNVIAGTGWAKGHGKIAWAVDAETGRLRFMSPRTADYVGKASLKENLVVFAEATRSRSGGGERVVALDSTKGREVWSLHISDLSPSYFYENVGYRCLAHYEDSTILAAEVGDNGVGRVFRIGNDGELQWQSARVIRYPQTPVAGPDKLVVPGSGILVSIDLETGRELWRIGGGDFRSERFDWALPVDGGVLYAKTEVIQNEVRTYIACASTVNGEEMWSWGADVPFAFGPAPVRGPVGLSLFLTSSAVAALDVSQAPLPAPSALASVVDAAASVANTVTADSLEAQDAKVQDAVAAEIARLKGS
jgi:outer membrane protein assembly factor BamB